MATGKTGIVLEGGGMRGMYTCGILDVLMENHIYVDGMVGVSAGIAFGCNYKSRCATTCVLPKTNATVASCHC